MLFRSGDESFKVVLGTPTGGIGIGRGTGLGTIINDDPGSGLPVLSLGSASIVESSSGTGSVLVVPVNLNHAAVGSVTGTFTIDRPGSTASWAAKAGQGGDFGGATTGTVLFKAGTPTGPSRTQAFIKIPIWSDTSPEGIETIRLTLSGVSTNATLGTATQDLQIIDRT